MDQIDDRFATVMQGVGTAKTLGRIHGVNLELGGTNFKAVISVVDSDNFTILLGLDMMTNYGWSINMRDECIVMKNCQRVSFIQKTEVSHDFGKTIQRHGSTLKREEHKNPDVANLIEMGYEEAESQDALKNHNGDKAKAIEELMEKHMNSTMSKINSLKKR